MFKTDIEMFSLLQSGCCALLVVRRFSFPDFLPEQHLDHFFLQGKFGASIIIKYSLILMSGKCTLATGKGMFNVHLSNPFLLKKDSPYKADLNQQLRATNRFIFPSFHLTRSVCFIPESSSWWRTVCLMKLGNATKKSGESADIVTYRKSIET